jgi:RNA polymerase sigma factor (sigma-70 family)
MPPLKPADLGRGYMNLTYGDVRVTGQQEAPRAPERGRFRLSPGPEQSRTRWLPAQSSEFAPESRRFRAWRGITFRWVRRSRKGHTMRDDPSVIALVRRVCDGDHGAWNEIVERYSPLVWSICARYQLSRPDTDDVGQGVWLMLVEHIGNLRQPAALPGWLATTTRNECLRVLRTASRYDPDGLPADDLMPPDVDERALEDDLIEAELNAALRAAFAELPEACHTLLSMLIQDPPPSYAEVGSALGKPVGSIGPTRARCLDQLRRSPHLAVFLPERAGAIEVTETGR